jgi:hypothetical protein
MSGGAFDYDNDALCHKVFDWTVYPINSLGEKGEYDSSRKRARRIDPLHDKMLSELLYDVFCLLHSLDWYGSGDCVEDIYLKDIAYFKSKWLKASVSELSKREIDASIDELREELYHTLLGFSTENQDKSKHMDQGAET